MLAVASADDPLVAGYRHLVDGGRRSRRERRAGVFVVEGERAIGQLLSERWPLQSILLAEAKAARRPELVSAAESAGAQVLVAGPALMERIAGYPVHRGALALAARPADRDPLEVLTGCALVLVVEAVNDFENLGSLFRNAAAFGVGAVLLDPRTADPLYRRCVRVSVGHVLRVPFARVGEWPGGLEALRRLGFSIVALSPDGRSTVDEVAAGMAGPVAVMVGSEGDGLTQEAMAGSDHVARIAMAGGVDSINVATAAAIALHRFRNR